MCIWFSSSATEKATLSVKIAAMTAKNPNLRNGLHQPRRPLCCFTFGNSRLHLLQVRGCLLHPLLQLLLCTLTGFKFGLQLCKRKRSATFRVLQPEMKNSPLKLKIRMCVLLLTLIGFLQTLCNGLCFIQSVVQLLAQDLSVVQSVVKLCNGINRRWW